MARVHNVRPVEAPDLDAALAALRARGLRASAARRLVLEVAVRGQRPADRRAGGGRARRALRRRTSVYRNLDTLEGVGLVRHFHLGHGPGLYVLAGTGAREFMLPATPAGACTPSTRPSSTRSATAIRRDHGWEARFTHFPISGLCPACARRAGHRRGQGPACTSLTASCPPRWPRPPAPSPWPPSPSAARGPTTRSTSGASRCSASPRPSSSPRRCSTSRWPAARAATSSAPRWPTILLGPWLACLVLAVVLAVQALLFADGGITALGANVLNMGVIGGAGCGAACARRARVLPRSRALVPRGVRGRRVARGHARRRGHGRRAGGVGDRPARHRAAGHARRARTDRHRRGGGDRGRGQRRAVARGPTWSRSPTSRRGPPASRRRRRVAVVTRLADARLRRCSRSPSPSAWRTAFSPFGLGLPGRPRAGRRGQGLPRQRPPARRPGGRARSRTTPSRGSRTTRLATGLAGFVGTLVVFVVGVVAARSCAARRASARGHPRRPWGRGGGRVQDASLGAVTACARSLGAPVTGHHAVARGAGDRSSRGRRVRRGRRRAVAVRALDPRAKLVGLLAVTVVAVSTPLRVVAGVGRRAPPCWRPTRSPAACPPGSCGGAAAGARRRSCSPPPSSRSCVPAARRRARPADRARRRPRGGRDGRRQGR